MAADNRARFLEVDSVGLAPCPGCCIRKFLRNRPLAALPPALLDGATAANFRAASLALAASRCGIEFHAT